MTLTEGYFELKKGKNEWVRLDHDHFGELWFTQEHQDKYGYGTDENDDEIFNWVMHTSSIEGDRIINDKGTFIREPTDEDLHQQ